MIDKPADPTYSVIVFAGPRLPEWYKNLILSKWMRSLRYGNAYYKLASAEPYFAAYGRYINTLLSHASSEVRLAVITDDPDVVLGWSLADGPVLHYVHVHKDHRRQGIGRRLVPPGVTTITHLTHVGASIWGSKMPGVSFNPFA